MEKQANSGPSNNYNGPTHQGAGAGNSSGVSVFDTATGNANPPLPPTYDQAMGNPPPSGIYTTTSGWSAAGISPHNPGYNVTNAHSTTTYTSYGHSVPPPQPSQSSRIPPPQATFAQPPPVVIIQQQAVLPLGPEPVYITCPACHVQKLTRIEYEPSTRTHLMAALLCIFGLWCCVCLPYCAGSCMNTHHYCGNCDKFLGTYGNTL